MMTRKAPAARPERDRPIPMSRVMELTGYSRGYIYQLVFCKKLPCHKPGGKRGKLFFFENEIMDFASRNKQSADYEIAEQADAVLNMAGNRKRARKGKRK
jgi:predicted DNA-binding transcriptional regulator AlpA